MTLSTSTLSGTAGNEIFENARCFTSEISAVKSSVKQALRTKNNHRKNKLIISSQKWTVL